MADPQRTLSTNGILSKDTLVPLGILFAAVGATAAITASATNANAKIDQLTGSVTTGFSSVNSRLAKIEATQDHMAPFQADILSRVAVLEAQMKGVQSVKEK